jgi:hypothetical protein
MAVEDHHLTVKAIEGSQAKVAMLAEVPDGDFSTVEALDQGACRGYLEECAVIHLQVIGKGGAD